MPRSMPQPLFIERCVSSRHLLPFHHLCSPLTPRDWCRSYVRAVPAAVRGLHLIDSGASVSKILVPLAGNNWYGSVMVFPLCHVNNCKVHPPLCWTIGTPQHPCRGIIIPSWSCNLKIMYCGPLGVIFPMGCWAACYNLLSGVVVPSGRKWTVEKSWTMPSGVAVGMVDVAILSSSLLASPLSAFHLGYTLLMGVPNLLLSSPLNIVPPHWLYLTGLRV